ncbi:hypothetical protein DdX_19039 [Ditylenchus destructor]|uniref:Uncharacterized protein n=1 Tax=Ditylenchus destructor TaxID=166010 RepID=A0AAD4ML63_9BILA|nr:hypothetical protein DdX_19039 [Ditylenchus destructor]
MASYKKSDLSKALRSHCLIWDIEDVASTISFFIVLISVSVIIVTCKAGVYSFLPILMIVCGIANILASFACFAGLLSGIEYFYFGPLVVFGIYTFLTLLYAILLLIVLALGANAQEEVMTSLGMSDGVIDVSTQSLTVVLFFFFLVTLVCLLADVIWMSILHHAYEKSSDKNREDFSSRASIGYQSSSVYSRSNFAADNAASRSQTPIASSVQQV